MILDRSGLPTAVTLKLELRVDLKRSPISTARKYADQSNSRSRKSILQCKLTSIRFEKNESRKKRQSESRKSS